MPNLFGVQTGDWQIFRCDAAAPNTSCNGYGNFKYQAENGGTGLMGTASFLWRAAVYPEVLEEFLSLNSVLNSAFAQIDSGDVSTPLLGQHRNALAAPVHDDLVRTLCVNIRRQAWGPNPDVNTTKDAWGDTLCDYHEVRSFRGVGACVAGGRRICERWSAPRTVVVFRSTNLAV